jgi:hypothetical protein
MRERHHGSPRGFKLIDAHMHVQRSGNPDVIGGFTARA